MILLRPTTMSSNTMILRIIVGNFVTCNYKSIHTLRSNLDFVYWPIKGTIALKYIVFASVHIFYLISGPKHYQESKTNNYFI